jgi:hypothetical protein
VGSRSHDPVCQHIAPTVNPFEGLPERTWGPARSVPDHALKGRVEAGTFMLGAWVTLPDPIVHINTAELRVPGSSERARSCKYQRRICETVPQFSVCRTTLTL